MAHTDTYSPEKIEALSEQLRLFLAASDENSPAVGVAESFQVWTVGLQDFRESGLSRAVWTGLWQHELRSPDGQADIFARSSDDVTPTIRSIYQSPLAGEIDRAVDAIDSDAAFEGDDFLVRLLEIPDAHLTAIWLSNASVNRLIPLGQFASAGRLVAGDHVVPEEMDFLEGVQANSLGEAELSQILPQKPVIGLSQNPPPGRRPDF